MVKTCEHCGFQKDLCECNNEPTTYEIEMSKLEENQRNLRANYENRNKHFIEAEYVRKLTQGSTLKYSISQGEKLKDYLPRLTEHVQMAQEKNVKIHVHNNGKKPWFTHMDKFGLGCFMCEDVNLEYYMLSLLQYLADKHPDTQL